MVKEKTYKGIIDFLETEGKSIDKNKEYSLKSLIDIGKTIPQFSLVLEETIFEGNLLLDDLLYATLVAIRLGSKIEPRTYLSTFNKTLEKTLDDQDKTEFIYQNNDVLIGEIVSVFNSLTLTDKNQTETVESLLGDFKWYQDYKDPLGLVED